MEQLQNSKEVLEKAKAVIATSREEMPAVREAISELRTEPKNAFEKLGVIAKEIWAKIVEVGLIAAIADAIKAIFGAGASAVGASVAAIKQRVAPSAQKDDDAQLIPVNAGPATPLIPAEDKV